MRKKFLLSKFLVLLILITGSVGVASAQIVAKIGDDTYSTFADALTAANNMTGDVTVEIYGAGEFTDGMELNGSYTSINFIGNNDEAKLTVNQTAGGDYLGAHGKTVSFTDLILAKANPAWANNSGHMGNYFSIQGGTVTYTNCTFPNGACTSGATATYTDCTFQNISEYGLWVYDDALVTVNGGTINSKKGIKVYSEDEGTVTSTLTVRNATFTENVTAKPAVAVGYAQSITLIGNTYNNPTAHVELDSGSDADCEGVTFVAEDAEGNDIASTLEMTDRSNSDAPCGVLCDGKIYTTVAQAAADATAGSTVTLLYDSTETVELPAGVILDTNGYTADGVTVTQPVAEIGETKYATLEAAFTAATEGQTITLLADATPVLTSQRAITKAAVIDLNNQTLTLTEDDLYFGTTTFQNGNIVVDPSVKPSTAVFWMFANQTLTFDNVKIVATGVTGTYLIGLDGNNSDLNLLNGSEIVVENTTALDLDIICVNASTGNDIKVENSKVNVTNLDGRVFFRGNYTVTNSEVNLEGITKAGFRIEAGQTLSIEGNSVVNITGEPRDGGIHLTDLTATYTKAETATVNATVNEPKVAKVGENTYKTLALAVAAVEDGGTITLIANETFTENNRYNNGGWWDGLGYSGDKSFTIDLAGFTISQDGALNDYLMWFKNDGAKANTITLKNGTLDAGTTAYCALATASSNAQKITVNLENIKVINNNYNGSTVKVRGGAELNVKDGTEITGKNSYLGIECVASTVNIYDGAKIYMNGTSSYNGCLVGACAAGTVNVYGGYGKGVKGGFIAMTSGGTINIEGGEWIANTDGTVGNNSNLYVLTAQSNKNESGFAGPSIINVTGGTFRGGMDAWVLNNVEGEKAELNIKGGNFNANPTSYVAEDYIAVENNGVWNVVKPVAKIGEQKFATLQAAINAAVNGDVVTLHADNAENVTVTQKPDVKFTIDGADKTMTGTITIDGKSAAYATAGITVKNMNFTAATEAVCINLGVSGNNNTRYTSNVTVERCNFTGTDKTAVGIKSYTGGDKNLIVNDCTATGMHSLMQLKNTAGVSVTECEITDSKNGISLGASSDVAINETIVDYDGYGVRADANDDNGNATTITDCTIEAFIPVVVRNASKDYALQFDGENTMTATNEDGLWCAIGTTEYETNGTMPTAPTGQVTVTLNDTGLSMDGVYGNYYEFSGEGTAENPYLINNLYELKYFRDDVNKGEETTYNAPGVWVALGADIDMTGVNWTPSIGLATADHGFMGNFDGKTYKIMNLTITNPALDSDGYAYAGLFGVTEGTETAQNTIKNLTIENVTISTTGSIVAAAIAYPYYTVVDNVTVKGNIKITGGDYTSGVLAYTRRCVNASNIIVSGSEDSYITGANVVGGVISDIQMNGGLTANYSNFEVSGVTITGTNMVGGISGIISSQTLNGATVRNVTLNSSDARVGIVAGCLGGTSTISNVTYENVTGATAVVGATYDGGEAVEAKIGDTYYATLQTAFAAAENETITLLIDTELSEMITIPNGKTVVLDLNGKTITGTDNTSKNFSIIDNRGNLTITDSSDPSTGKITLTATTNSGWNRYSAVIANNPGGKLTIEAGTLEHLGGTDMAYGIDNLTNGKGTYAETVINGGYIKSTYRGIRQFLNGTEAQNILTVNGGTIEGANKSIWMQDPSVNANTGTLEVRKEANLIGDVYLYVTPNSTSWPVEVSIAAEALAEGSEVMTANVPAGYELQQDADGNYVVNQGVAKIGEVLYETLQEAINTVENNGIIVLIRDTDQNILAGNENLKPLNKVFTIDGDNHVVTGNWRFGRDDHNTDLSEITIKNVNFKGNGISILDFYKVTISECTFNDITTGNAIYVSADEYTSSIVVENCEMNNIEGAGINFRNPVNATVKGNKINGTGNNSITFQHGTAYTEAETGEYIIENNIFQNWANEASEGRALRIATGVKPRAITIENNVMIKDNAPEEFVKVTGNTDNVSVDENYWNGANPTSSNTPAYFLAEGVQVHNYYAAYDAETNTLDNLVTIEGAGETLEIFYTAAGVETTSDNAAYSLSFTVTDYASKEVSVKIGNKPAQNSAIHLVTPETVEFDNVEFDVTSVANNGFNGTSFKKVTISEGVETIGNKALYFMSKLTELVLPSTLVSVGEQCIGAYNPNSVPLKSIVCYAAEAPSAFEPTSNASFQTCVKQQTMLIVPNAADYTVYSNASGWKFTNILGIGSTKEIAGKDDKYTLLATVTSMDPMECSIKIGSTKPAANSNAELVIPEVVDYFPSVEGLDFTVTSIPNNAFSSCLYFVGDLVIPQNVRTIGAGAFNTSHFVANETVRGTLTLNEGLVSIGSQAFKKDYFKGDLSIPSTVETIASNAFQYASFDGTLTINGNIYCANAFGGTGFTELVLVEGVEEIKDSNAFSGMLSLKEVVLPSTLQTVGMAAFKDDDAIEVIHTYATEVPAINSIPGNVNYKYAFSETVKANAVLYVHGTSYDDVLKYKNATNEWNEFANIHLYGAVAQIGEVEYLTLQAAMNAAENGKTITMIANAELTETVTIPAGKEVVLDLNGYTVSYTTTEYVGEAMITNNGNLTITDTSDEKTGSLSYAYEGGANSSYGFGNSTIENKGVLTINAGTVENTSAAMSHASYAINTGAGATLNVEGGNILNLNGHAVRMVSFGTELNTVNINGGYIEGTRALQVQLPGSASSTTKPAMDLNITGGELKSNEETYNLAIYVFSNGQSAEKVSVEISGGTFNGNVAVNAAATNSMLANAVAITGGTFNGDYGVFSYSDEDAAQAVISITGGTFATNYSEWYAEDEQYVFELNENGTYSVVEQTIFTQTRELAQGWNWFSYYVNTDLTALETALGENGVQITSKTDGFVAYNSQYGWSGNLSSITESQMYMINVGASHDLELSGELVGPTSITLHQGWNWIGFPMSEAVSVTDALAGFEAKSGDQIKSKDNGFASYNSQYGWGGTLSTLNPGEGYMYQSNNSETTELFYSAGTRGELKANVTTDGNHWIPNAGQYPNNMTMTAMVEVEGGDYEVAAFVDGEVRGSARPIYVEALDSYMLFLTIHGEGVEEMTFKFYDLATGEEYALNDRINYSNDAIIGSLTEPYIFNRGTTGIGEASLSDINIYPNPTTTGTEINLQSTCDTVEVFNALGVKVAEYHNVDSIDAFETAGIYVIRITDNGDVKHCRLIVK